MQTERTDTGCGVGGGEGSIDIHTFPSVKLRTRGKLLCSAGSSACCSVTTQKRGMGVGGRLRREGIHVCI